MKKKKKKKKKNGYIKVLALAWHSCTVAAMGCHWFVKMLLLCGILDDCVWCYIDYGFILILGLPEGYNTLCSECGNSLFGGQRRRNLAIYNSVASFSMLLLLCDSRRLPGSCHCYYVTAIV
jgi:hypothetical protein